MSAERESVGSRALMTMGDGAEAFCLVKECRKLERDFGTKFTEKLLKDGVASYPGPFKKSEWTWVRG